MLPTARIRSRATPSATHRSTSSGSCAQTRSNNRNVGATKNRNRRNLLSDLGDKRAFTKIVGIPRWCAHVTRFGQTSASTSAIRAGLITKNARSMIGQYSRGVYITVIHVGALLFVRDITVVVV